MLGLVLSSAGCFESDSSPQVIESSTVVDIDPEETPPAQQAPDPNSIVCDPFNANGGERTQGIKAQLYYLEDGQPQYNYISDYFNYGTSVTGVDLFFNQLFIPTRPFDRGFTTQGGVTLTNLQGNTLYEWFALKFSGQIRLSSQDAEGLYQFALLSDDGSLLKMDNGTEMAELINSDGFHSTKLSCATQPVQLTSASRMNYEIDYFQGPRFHIAMTLLWRPWSDSDYSDPLCGKQGNATFFDSTQNPPAPKTAYNQLLSRGWKPLAPENYSLKEEDGDNPCNDPAPVLSNVAIANIATNGFTMTWNTDIGSTSKLIVTLSDGSLAYESPIDSSLVTSHSVTVSSLSANTVYRAKVQSKSRSGLMTESLELSVRTRR